MSQTRPSTISAVVLVEDDAVAADGVAAVLELEGVEVRIANRGAEAVPLIEARKPDAVILDIALPDMNGTEVYRQIAKRWPDLPVLFASGHADESHLALYLSRPNVGFLQKPYDMQSLILTLQRLAAGRR